MTKFSKKVVAVLLSVLMVISALPFTAVSAFAADGEEYSELDAAIAAYEDKIETILVNTNETGYLYTNMTAAYDLYVQANKLRDAYKYGNDNTAKTQFATAAANLNTAINNMQPWAYSAPASKAPTYSDTAATESNMLTNTGGRYVASDYIANILYTTNVTGTASKNNNSTGYAAKFSNTGMEVSVYYPKTVVTLYDGVNQPKIPVMMSSKATGSNDRYIYTVYPTSTGGGLLDRSDIYLANKGNRLGNAEKSWQGGAYRASISSSGGCYSADFIWAIDNSYTYIGQDAANAVRGSSLAMNNGGTKAACYRNQIYYSSALVIDEKFNFNGAGYTTWTSIPWAFYGGGKDTQVWTGTNTPDTNLGGQHLTPEADYNIYAINYKALLTALTNARAKLTAADFDIANYKQGGLKAILQAVDTAQTYDISTKNFANNTVSVVQSTANEVLAMAAALNDTELTADVNYTALKTAMINEDKLENQWAKTKYNNGNVDNKNYVKETWEPFEAAYKEAQDFFAAVPTNGYTWSAEKQKEVADRIVLTESELIVNKILVDTSSLDAILENAYAIVTNKQYFNSSDYASSGIEALVRNCITELWGDVSNYGDDTMKLEDSEAARAIVAKYIAPLTAAVQANQINYNAVIPSLAYSMNSALTEAAGYEANRSDYANYSTLEAAVADAERLKTQFDGYAFDADVSNQVKNTVNNYINYTTKIINAIRSLRPAFDKIENGTIANPGNEDTISYSLNGGRWSFAWTRTNNIIYFKTTRDAVQWKLPVNYFTFSTTEGYDACLDSINFLADPANNADLNGDGYVELTSKSAVAGQNPSGWELNQAQCNQFPGGMRVIAGGITLSMENVKVTSSSATEFAKDLSGNNITDMNADLSEVLLTTEGTNPISGCITAKKGSTVFSADAMISLATTTGAPTINTTVTNRSKAFSATTLGASLGIVYYWKYQPFLRYAGYSYAAKKYDQNIYVVDLSVYKEVVSEVEALAKTDANNYTISSWSTLMNALTAAKSEMDYGNMTFEQITSVCDTRYKNLWNARENLKAPASNASLKEIIEQCKEVYANDEAKCSPESWAAFKTAYTDALSALNGRYSDTDIRQFAFDDAETIAGVKALVDALRTAYENLAYKIDFSILDLNAHNLVDTLENGKYTAESLVALKNALANMPNLNMSEAERVNHFTSETDLVAAVKAEETAITELASLLVEASASTEVLEAAKADAKAKFSDPDAYNLSDIQAILDSLNAYQDVSIPDYLSKKTTYSVSGAKYTSQPEADAACANALSTVQIQQYTVTRDGETIATVPYGSEITVESADGSVVDWYYKSISNTANSAEKLFSTGDAVTFIVKGNTELRTKKAENEDTKKITFINALNGRTYDVQYVPVGTTVNLADEVQNAPKLAYYGFSHFTANTTDGDAITSLTVNYDVTVFAIYTYGADADTYKLSLAKIGSGGSAVFTDVPLFDWSGNSSSSIIGDKLKYNDRITLDPELYFTEDDLFSFSVIVNNRKHTVSDEGVFIDDEMTDYETNYYGLSRDSSLTDSIYAFAKVKIPEGQYDDYVASFAGMLDTATTEDFLAEMPDLEAEVVTYGDAYSFYIHEDTILVGLTETEFSDWMDAGIIAEDYTITVTDYVRKNDDGTMSIIGTYCLPQGAEVVENGILFTASSKTINVDKLTLSEASQNGKIKRIKSTLHTVANQYVITVNITAKGTYNIKYCGFLTYKLNGQTYTVYSNTQDGTFTVQ